MKKNSIVLEELFSSSLFHIITLSEDDVILSSVLRKYQ